MSDEKWYLVRYALSDGIQQVTLRGYSEGDDYCYTEENQWVGYRIGRDLIRGSTAAIAAAMKMRDKKIASLKRQLAKLEATTFEGE